MEQNEKLHPKGLDSNKSKMHKPIKLETKNIKIQRIKELCI